VEASLPVRPIISHNDRLENECRSTSRKERSILTGPAYAVDLNRDLLAGSPYCFAEDAAGETRAKELLDLLVEIRGRQERASQAFREKLEQVRKEVEQTPGLLV
jgi:uncharacterized protein CbrC (UPF0167 family)